MRRGLTYHNRRSSGGYNPFSQLGPTLDLTFAGNVTNLSDSNGFTLDTNFVAPQYLIGAQYTIWETGVGLVSKTFSDIITFTRASTGTYFNSAGVLTSAAINAPRFDYNPSTFVAQGLLIEEARTNLLTYSADYTNAAWGAKTGLSLTTGVTAPDGTSSLNVQSTAAGTRVITQTATTTASTAYTASVYMQKNATNFGALSIVDGANSAFWTFNLNTGAVGTNVVSTLPSTATIKNVGSGWYHCTVTATASTTTLTAQALPVNSVSSGISAVGDSVYVWGAQLEAGAFPTSYIPTTTTALTRAADVASVNTLSPWFNASAGTIYAEGSAASNTPDSRFAVIDDGSSNNRYQLGLGSSYTGNFAAVSGGVVSADLFSAALTAGSTVKLAGAYTVNDFALCANGGTVATDTSGVLPVSPTTLRLGKFFGPAGFLNGYLRRITYYPRRLSNAELQAITA